LVNRLFIDRFDHILATQLHAFGEMIFNGFNGYIQFCGNILIALVMDLSKDKYIATNSWQPIDRREQVAMHVIVDDRLLGIAGLFSTQLSALLLMVLPTYF